MPAVIIASSTRNDRKATEKKQLENFCALFFPRGANSKTREVHFFSEMTSSKKFADCAEEK